MLLPPLSPQVPSGPVLEVTVDNCCWSAYVNILASIHNDIPVICAIKLKNPVLPVSPKSPKYIVPVLENDGPVDPVLVADPGNPVGPVNPVYPV